MCLTNEAGPPDGSFDGIGHRQGTIRSVDGVELAWQAWVPRTRPIAVVGLVHGGAEHGGRYRTLVHELVGAAIAVYAVDLRGHGRSAGRRGSVRRFSHYLDDIDALVTLTTSAHPQAPRFLVGYSLGGLASTLYALDHQHELSGVVLAGPALGVGTRQPGPLFTVVRWLAAVAPWLRVLRMDPEAMMQDPAAVTAYRNDPFVYHGRLDVRLLSEIMGAIHQLYKEIHRLQSPLLILHGDDDVTAHPDGSWFAIRRARSSDKTLRIYQGLRHDLFNEPHREAVCTEVREWIHTHLETVIPGPSQSTRLVSITETRQATSMSVEFPSPIGRPSAHPRHLPG